MHFPRLYAIYNAEGLYWDAAKGWAQFSSATLFSQGEWPHQFPADGVWIEVTTRVQAAFDAAVSSTEGNTDWEEVDPSSYKLLRRL